MKGASPVVVALVLAVAILGGSARAEATVRTPPADGPSNGGWITSKANGSSVDVSGEVERETGRQPEQPTSTRASYAHRRIPLTYCGSADGLATSPTACIDGVSGGTVSRTCADGTAALDPLFRREIDPATGAFIGPWQQVDSGGCPEDPPVTVVLTAADFSRLPLTPSAPQIQPADGRGLVNADLIVYTDPGTQTLTTTVLGVPVTVRATPTRFAWDFGDGTPALVTSDPGAPYPRQTVARPYTSPGTYRLTLSTTWAGTYQVNNSGPWFDVLGTATTVSAPRTAEIAEVHTVLVANP